MIQRFWKKTWKGNKPPSVNALHRASTMRMSEIIREFKETFDFLGDYPRSVTFFGSTRLSDGSRYYEQARTLAAKIVKETGYAIVTGGGPGIMEAANRGAFEAGGQSIGMHIKLPAEQKKNSFLTASRKFYYFFVRKVALAFSAEVYIFFPGGFGTMDEFFEIATLVQTSKIPRVPIICIGKEYWKDVNDLIISFRDKYQTISHGDEKLFEIVDEGDDERILEIIKKAPLRKE
ncbi:MAG: TIGR00730 family Rossman fold protein [Candidatus Taylorbacteria bacterium CG10_big_fil_rev_8_21_14_0_10_41_48]|uniref:Cytokinin riboside 5'-monophosphate phosphoribohydrolase n=1 Tax=Candidatus Taylorbacteria bacterium CG10_big_fil_rev_8_21_14_0_10_41_48 TaxID=1975024 RepID=A0A2M8LCA8_9BACT|nr:MAG: TIGR00730 family Rossman fold protein [Candidatus Taylorbacteria bacterium CG10_big_fil_rev_8_21_14_0_10_41_48]